MTRILSENPEYWDALRTQTRKVIQSKNGGVLDITMDELSTELLQTGKGAVSEELKRDFLVEIHESIELLVNRNRA